MPARSAVRIAVVLILVFICLSPVIDSPVRMNNEVEAGLLYEGRSNLLKFVVPDGVAVDLKEKSFRVRTPLKGFAGSIASGAGSSPIQRS